MTAREWTAAEEAEWQTILTRYDCAEWLPFDKQLGRCPRCGNPPPPRRRRWCSRECESQWREQHDWGVARNAAKRRDGHQCVREGCDVRTALEVNHIVPRNGGGYGWGCWNHLTNLETLCHQHHLEVTRQQAADREALYRRRDEQIRDERTGQTMLPLGQESP